MTAPQLSPARSLGFAAGSTLLVLVALPPDSRALFPSSPDWSGMSAASEFLVHTGIFVASG